MSRDEDEMPGLPDMYCAVILNAAYSEHRAFLGIEQAEASAELYSRIGGKQRNKDK